MKKKAFLSLFVATLLSFSMMAKSNYKITKVKHGVVKKHNVVAKKSTSNKVFSCLPVSLSCGISGWACGETFQDIIDNAFWADGRLCG